MLAKPAAGGPEACECDPPDSELTPSILYEGGCDHRQQLYRVLYYKLQHNDDNYEYKIAFLSIEHFARPEGNLRHCWLFMSFTVVDG